MPEDVLWKYSYANLIMMLATVPDIDPDEMEEETNIVNSTSELSVDILKKHNLL